MEPPSNVIAWLVPTARGSPADKTTHMPDNVPQSITISSSPHLISCLSDVAPVSKPQRAIALTFDNPPKRPGSFVLGTDPVTCDVVLPPMPGISAQHCCFRFDAQARLVLKDYSVSGTQVWYDWECRGDQTDYTWLLSSGRGGDALPQRITVDIQGVRFDVIVNDHSSNWEAYGSAVEEFNRQPSWSEDLLIAWEGALTAPIAPLFTTTPLFKHIFVKALGDGQPLGEFYLWSMARPWEPMVRAAA